MNPPNFPHISRHWRFNSTLLSNSKFFNFFEEQISLFFEINNSPETSSLIVWDALKAFLRGQIISYSANLKRKASAEKLQLAKQIKEIDLQYAQSNKPELYQKCTELQARFDLLSTHSIERQILKSKSRFYIHGDKTGKMLANQLRETRVMRHITEIKMEDGNVTTDFS